MASFLSPAVESGLLGPGVDVDQTPVMDLSRLGQLPGMLAEGALDATAGFTKRALSGRLTQQQMIEGAADAAMTVGGGGMLVPKPLGALGVFGGKMRSAVGSPVIQRTSSQTGLISQRLRTPSGAEGSAATRVRRTPNSPDTVDLELSFAVLNPKTGRMSVREADIPVKEGREIFTAAMNEARRHIELVQPQNVRFMAARPELLGIYHRVAAQIAKEKGGVFIPPRGNNPDFNVRLPNPRKFKAGEGDAGAVEALRQSDELRERAMVARAAARMSRREQ